MDIVKIGTIPQAQRYMVTCSHCQTIFRFKGTEAHMSPNPYDTQRWIRCPICKVNIAFTAEDTDTGLAGECSPSND